MNCLGRFVLLALLANAFWAVSIPLAHATEAELRIIPLKHRLAEEVVPAVRPLLAAGESVNSMDSRLIVRAATPTFMRIERLLVEIDTPRRNLRISVRHAGEREHLETIQEISGDARLGGTRLIVTNGNHSSGGVTIWRSGQDGTVQLHSERRISTTRGSSAQTLTVQDGGRAFLRVGESTHYVQQFLMLAGNRPGMVTGIQYQDVTTGFEVEPHIQGEQILLAVSPRLAFRSDRGAQDVHFQELRTLVHVRPGEWLDLGSAVGSANEVNRQIFSTRRSAGSEDSRFQIRVDPL